MASKVICFCMITISVVVGAPQGNLAPSQVGVIGDFPWALYNVRKRNSWGTTLQILITPPDDLVKQIRPDAGSGNIFFSPASLNVALGMLYAGARGQTAEAMRSALKWPSDIASIMAQTQDVLKGDRRRNLTLTSANRIYVDNTAKLRSSYQEKLENVYKASAQPADFVNQADAERVKINDWVAEKTNGLIKDLFPKGQLNKDTQAVLVNAIYFKALWKLPFKTQRTHKATFTTYDNKKVDTDFMYGSGFYELSSFPRELDATLIRIPYQDDDTSFNIILPGRNVELRSVEENLTPKMIEEAEKNLQLINNVDLTLPKFEMTQPLKMKKILQKLGLENLFGTTANFTGIFEGKKPFTINEVLHKAHVTVDEKGTEAAAATGIQINVVSLGPQVMCNKPFIFYIKRKSEIIFIGRLANPATMTKVEARSGLATQEEPTTGLIQRMEDFPLALYKVIRKGQDHQNLFFSPASINYVLGMVYAGTRGQTQKIMRGTLKWSEKPNEVQEMMRSLQTALTGNKAQNLILTSANRIYVDRSATLNPDYLVTLRDVYGSEAVPADFQNRAARETDAINGWVANKTNNLIKELFEQGQLNEATQMVLVNALYFKGLWEKKFDPQRSEKGIFKTSDQREVEATFMNANGDFGHTFSPSLDATFLRLPYQGEDTSFNIILPSETGSLTDVEEKLTLTDIEEVEQSLTSPRKAILSLPKFELSQDVKLKDALKALGLENLFSDLADLTGVTTDKRPLKVDEAVHKAYVSVNEEGTKAGAATGITFQLKSSPVRPLKIVCDRPFVFYIKKNAQIIFMGRITDPTK